MAFHFDCWGLVPKVGQPSAAVDPCAETCGVVWCGIFRLDRLGRCVRAKSPPRRTSDERASKAHAGETANGDKCTVAKTRCLRYIAAGKVCIWAMDIAQSRTPPGVIRTLQHDAPHGRRTAPIAEKRDAGR